MTDKQEKYFDLFFKERINEYKKIDKLKNWNIGTARKKYNLINTFYLEELEINQDELMRLKKYFEYYKSKYDMYYSIERREFFLNDPEKLIKWFQKQKDKCGYCEISQADLLKIVEIRGGNLTLNRKTKRSKGVLEIERRDSTLGYDFKNCILACPLCNNAKSNLIDEDSWCNYFKPAMKAFYQELLKEDEYSIQKSK